uniref:Uncharacterized protein n=1 Tax=Arundo donax TaxID=35708 RepID=A0A0A9FNQ8_ARUDO
MVALPARGELKSALLCSCLD